MVTELACYRPARRLLGHSSLRKDGLAFFKALVSLGDLTLYVEDIRLDLVGFRRRSNCTCAAVRN